MNFARQPWHTPRRRVATRMSALRERIAKARRTMTHTSSFTQNLPATFESARTTGSGDPLTLRVGHAPVGGRRRERVKEIEREREGKRERADIALEQCKCLKHCARIKQRACLERKSVPAGNARWQRRRQRYARACKRAPSRDAASRAHQTVCVKQNLPRRARCSRLRCPCTHHGCRR